MRSIIRLTLGLGMICLLVSPASADFTGGAFRWYSDGGYNTFYAPAQVRLTMISGAGMGGAFSVSVRDGSLPMWGSGNDLFTTFCVESQITFQSGNWYWCSVDANAYSGGVGLAGDPITDVTEWIYDQWLVGNPADWTQSEIFQAIWMAEGETGGAATAPYMAALAHYGYANNPDVFGVAAHTRALNLWGGFYEVEDGVWAAADVQTQLIHIPAPAAALLAAFGLGLAGRVKRRL